MARVTAEVNRSELNYLLKVIKLYFIHPSGGEKCPLALTHANYIRGQRLSFEAGWLGEAAPITRYFSRGFFVLLLTGGGKSRFWYTTGDTR